MAICVGGELQGLLDLWLVHGFGGYGDVAPYRSQQEKLEHSSDITLMRRQQTGY